MHYEYLQKKGLDKNSPFVIEPAKDGSYTVVANSTNTMFNGKIALAAEAWQRRTGIVFKIAYKMPKNKQGVIYEIIIYILTCSGIATPVGIYFARRPNKRRQSYVSEDGKNGHSVG